MAQSRHATGSARTRRSLDNQPDGPVSTVVAARAGEWMQIDPPRIDWDRVGNETADNDFAAAFLVLADRLGITD